MAFLRTIVPLSLFLMLLAASGCKPTIEISSTTQPTAQKAFNKILVLEADVEPRAYDFYNNLRRDLGVQMKQRGIECEFVRSTNLLDDPESRFKAKLAEFEPQVVITIRTVKYRRRKWGPTAGSIKEIELNIALGRPNNHAVLWESTFFVAHVPGVDAATYKATKQLVARLVTDKVIQ